MYMEYLCVTLACLALQSSVTLASITVPYIKPMLLGRTFDYSKSKVGNDIYPAAVRQNPLKTNHYKTHITYSMIRSAKDIRDVLDVSGHLSVQIMAGLLDIKGRGSYLKESSESGNFIEVLAKVSYETITKSITDDKKPNPNWDKQPHITGQHYVRSITYGGTLIASLKFHAKNEKDTKKVEAMVDVSLNTGVVGVGIGGQFKKLASSVKDISTLTISYTATAPLKTVPTDIDSLIQAIKDFPSLVAKVDGGIGVPIDAELIELSKLSSSPKLQFLIDGAIQTRLTTLESMYYDLRTTTDAIKKFLKRNPYLSKDSEKQIGALYSKVFRVIEKFNIVIANIDLNVYSKKSSDQFKSAFDEYKQGGTFLPDKFLREYKSLAAKLEPTDTNIGTKTFVAFHATLDTKQIISTGPLTFNKVDFNIGGAFDNKTSVFKAPSKGVYQFSVSVLPWSTRTRSRESAGFSIMKGKDVYSKVRSNPSAKSTQISKTVLILLNKGESVYIKLDIGSVLGRSRYGTFGGHLVRLLL